MIQIPRPPGWDQRPLDAVASLARTTITPDRIPSGTAYVGLEHVDGEGNIEPCTVDSGELSSNKFAFTADHILYGKLRPYLRKIARPDGPGVCTTEIVPIAPGPAVDRDFLYYHLRQQRLIEFATERCAGANLPRLSPQLLAKFPVPLPPLPDQRRIANILDKADAIRRKRREAVALTEELVRSAFLEIFGDPLTNPMGWPMRPLRDLYINERDGTKCGPFGSALKKHEFVDSGVPVWNMDNIDSAGRMALPFRMWITQDKFRELEQYAVQDGDVLISRAGTVGKMCVAESGEPFSLLSTNLIRLRLGKELLPIYFVSLMTYCRGRVGRLRTGADGAFTHMNTGILDRLRVPCPPLADQQRYAHLRSRINRLRSTAHHAVAEADTLFHSLVQRAFRGEL